MHIQFPVSRNQLRLRARHFFFVSVLAVLPSILLSQTYSHVLEGANSPTSIPDSVAYRMLFLSNLSGNDLSLLSPSDKATFHDATAKFRSQYTKQVIGQRGGGQAARDNRDMLVENTRMMLSHSMTAEGLSELDSFVQAHKRNISIYSSSVVVENGATPSDVAMATSSGGSFTVSHFEGGDDSNDSAPVDESITLDGQDTQIDYCTDTATTNISFAGGNLWQTLISDSTIGPGGNLTTGADGGTFYANGTGRIWQYNGKSMVWSEMTPSIAITSIAAGTSSNVWGLSTPGSSPYNNIYYRDTDNTWVIGVGGWLKQLSVAGDGTMAGVNPYGQAFVLSTSTMSWTQISPPVVPTTTAVADSAVAYVLGTNGQVYYYSIAGNSFTAIPSPPGVTFQEIAAHSGMFSYDSTLVPEVYGLSTNGTVYKQSCYIIAEPAGTCYQQGVWSQVGGVTAVHVTAGRDLDLFVGNGAGALVHYLPSTTKVFQAVGTSAGDYITQTNDVTINDLLSVGSGSVNTRVTNSCSGLVFSYVPLFSLDEGLFYTQEKYVNTQGCAEDKYGVTYCSYNTVAYCTAATTPPNYQPKGVIDFEPAPYGWDTWGSCLAIKWFNDTWTGWVCVGAPIPALKKWAPLIAVTCDNRAPGAP